MATPFPVKLYSCLAISIGHRGCEAVPPFRAPWCRICRGGNLVDPVIGYYLVFVGSLCAIGVLLFTYKGYESLDALLSRLAGGGAIGTALIPTRGAGGEE